MGENASAFLGEAPSNEESFNMVEGSTDEEMEEEPPPLVEGDANRSWFPGGAGKYEPGEDSSSEEDQKDLNQEENEICRREARKRELEMGLQNSSDEEEDGENDRVLTIRKAAISQDPLSPITMMSDATDSGRQNESPGMKSLEEMDERKCPHCGFSL